MNKLEIRCRCEIDKRLFVQTQGFTGQKKKKKVQFLDDYAVAKDEERPK